MSKNQTSVSVLLSNNDLERIDNGVGRSPSIPSGISLTIFIKLATIRK